MGEFKSPTILFFNIYHYQCNSMPFQHQRDGFKRVSIPNLLWHLLSSLSVQPGGKLFRPLELWGFTTRNTREYRLGTIPMRSPPVLSWFKHVYKHNYSIYVYIIIYIYIHVYTIVISPLYAIKPSFHQVRRAVNLAETSVATEVTTVSSSFAPSSGCRV